MIVFLLIVGLLSLYSRVTFSLGLILLTSATFYFVNQMNLGFSIATVLLIVFSVLAIPLSFFLLGAYIDSFIIDKFKFKILIGPVFLIYGLYLTIEKGFFFVQLQSSLEIAKIDGAKDFLLLLEIISKAGISMTGAAAFLFFLSLIFLLPIAWLSNNSELKLPWSFPAFNLLLIIFFLSAGYQLIFAKILS